MKRWVLSKSVTGRYVMVDRHTHTHTEYCESLRELFQDTCTQTRLLKNMDTGRVYNMLTGNYVSPCLLESDIPITAENYPELLI